MATRYLPKGTTDLSTISIADTDDVIVAEGSQYVSTGLNFNSLTEGLKSFTVMPGFTGRIGGGGAGSFRADFDGGAPNRLRYAAGGGSIDYYPGGDETVCGLFENLSNGTANINTGGTLTVLSIGSGVTNVTTDVVATTVYMQGGVFNCDYKATVITTAYFGGGVVNCGRGFTTLNVGGNAQVTIRREDTGATLPAATTINLWGGTLKWCGGAVTTINVYGDTALLDLSGMANGATIGTLNIISKAKRRALLENIGLANTISTTNEFIGTAGMIGVSGVGGFGG